jgi:serine/threonine protein kinase
LLRGMCNSPHSASELLLRGSFDEPTRRIKHPMQLSKWSAPTRRRGACRMTFAKHGCAGVVIGTTVGGAEVALKIFTCRDVYERETRMYRDYLEGCDFVPHLVAHAPCRIAFELCPWDLMDAKGTLGQPPVHVIRAIVRQVLDAYGYAHAMGLVYTDLKSENIVLARDGRVKLCDASSFCQRHLACKDNIVMTCEFTPPELQQCMGRRLFGDQAAFWQLGVFILDLFNCDCVFPKVLTLPVAAYTTPDRMFRRIGRLHKAWRSSTSGLLNVQPPLRTKGFGVENPYMALKMREFIYGVSYMDCNIMHAWLEQARVLTVRP